MEIDIIYIIIFKYSLTLSARVVQSDPPFQPAPEYQYLKMWTQIENWYFSNEKPSIIINNDVREKRQYNEGIELN